jgi:hypothetical protein
VQSTYLIETQLVPALVRTAAALERFTESPRAEGPGPGRAAAAAVRRAIAESRWGRAEQLLDGFRRDHSGDAEASSLAAELARARQAEADDLRAQLDTARAADDPDQVITCRDALTQHLRGEPLKDLDRRVVRWLADLVERHIHAGTVTPDIAALAERAADSFADTAEGASLQAAVPNLRRRAGLCPVCARPHRGSGDACPACRAEEPVAPTPRPRPGGAISGGGGGGKP